MLVLTICILFQTESVPIATYNQLLDANHCTMTAVRDKSRAAADQMNAAAKNAEQAVRYVLGMGFRSVNILEMSQIKVVLYLQLATNLTYIHVVLILESLSSVQLNHTKTNKSQMQTTAHLHAAVTNEMMLFRYILIADFSLNPFCNYNNYSFV